MMNTRNLAGQEILHGLGALNLLKSGAIQRKVQVEPLLAYADVVLVILSNAGPFTIGNNWLLGLRNHFSGECGERKQLGELFKFLPTELAQLELLGSVLQNQLLKAVLHLHLLLLLLLSEILKYCVQLLHVKATCTKSSQRNTTHTPEPPPW
jgi:hypothetical protein